MYDQLVRRKRRKGKRERGRKGRKEKRVLARVGSPPFFFKDSKVCSKGARGEVKKEMRVRASGGQEKGTGLP